MTKPDLQRTTEGDMPHHTPRWVKMFGVTALVLILLFIILHLMGAGFGGHMMHMNHGGQQG